MKFNSICIIASLLFVIPTYTRREAPDTMEPEEEIEQIEQVGNPKAEIIIGSVANIAANIISIKQDKHNRPNVCHNALAIIGNIANIILAARHNRFKSETDLLDYLINELHLDTLLIEAIEKEVIKNETLNIEHS